MDVFNKEIISYEALVRGPNGEPAASVFARIPRNYLDCYDEVFRRKAMRPGPQLQPPLRDV